MKVKWVTPEQIKKWIPGLSEEERNRHVVVILPDNPEESKLLEELVITLHDNNVMR